MRSKKMILNTEVLREKALYFARELNCNDFKATNKYISKFKKRNNILFSKFYGESDSVDEEVVENWNQKLKDINEKNSPEDVYNLDETALFHRLLPSKTYCFANEKRYGQKKSKDRITLVFITNADGSDRICSMIGKSKNPRAFRGVSKLPIEYYSQNNAWIDSYIYKQILIKLNRKMKKKNKKILLFVDNYSTHILDIELSNVETVFFPPNTTSVLQVLT